MAGREYASVVVVALLVIASGGATYAGGQSAVATDADDAATGLVVDELLTRFADEDAADAVYIDRSGDAVFRYENSSDVATAEPLRGEFGVELGPGLAHALYAGDVEPTGPYAETATGNATTWATEESVTSAGELVVEDPRDLESLSADAQWTRTGERAASTLELTGTVANDTRLYGSADAEGTLETTATTLTTSGTVRTTVPDGADEGPIALDERRNLTVTETDGVVRLEAAERRSVGEWERDRWETEADARTSLENRYDEVAIALGGDASLTLEDYAFDGEGNRTTVEVAYTVAFTDIKDGLAERVTRDLEATTGVELDENETRVLVDRLATVSIEEISVDVVQRGLETDLEWEAELEGTDAFVLGIAEIAGSNDRLADAWADRYQAVRSDLEAQRAAGLVRETTWTASLEHDRAAERTTVEAVAESTVENWERYGAAREERGLEPIPATTATGTAELVDGDLEASYEYETGPDGYGLVAFEQLLRLADADLGPALDLAVAPFTDAEFEVARFDAALDDGRAEIESAAALDGVSTLGRVPGSAADVTAVHAETGGERTTVYVTVEAAFDGEPAAAEIREHPHVGPATGVYGPGEWDRAAPRIDADAVRSFLEVKPDGETADPPGADAGLPRGTAVAAGVGLTALLTASLSWIPWRRVTARRRE